MPAISVGARPILSATSFGSCHLRCFLGVPRAACACLLAPCEILRVCPPFSLARTRFLVATFCCRQRRRTVEIGGRGVVDDRWQVKAFVAKRLMQITWVCLSKSPTVFDVKGRFFGCAFQFRFGPWNLDCASHFSAGGAQRLGLCPNACRHNSVVVGLCNVFLVFGEVGRHAAVAQHVAGV